MENLLIFITAFLKHRSAYVSSLMKIFSSSSPMPSSRFPVGDLAIKQGLFPNLSFISPCFVLLLCSCYSVSVMPSFSHLTVVSLLLSQPLSVPFQVPYFISSLSLQRILTGHLSAQVRIPLTSIHTDWFSSRGIHHWFPHPLTCRKRVTTLPFLVQAWATCCFFRALCHLDWSACSP